MFYHSKSATAAPDETFAPFCCLGPGNFVCSSDLSHFCTSLRACHGGIVLPPLTGGSRFRAAQNRPMLPWASQRGQDLEFSRWPGGRWRDQGQNSKSRIFLLDEHINLPPIFQKDASVRIQTASSRLRGFNFVQITRQQFVASLWPGFRCWHGNHRRALCCQVNNPSFLWVFASYSQWWIWSRWWSCKVRSRGAASHWRRHSDSSWNLSEAGNGYSDTVSTCSELRLRQGSSSTL